MAAFDTNRLSTAPAGVASHIGQTFVAMAAFNAAPATERAPLALRLRLGLAHLVALYQDWQDRRSTRDALAGLSDRELDDIGLSRADLDTLR